MSISPGDRINLLRRIADTLGEQSWSDIDLTLEEFGFPTKDQWNGTRRDYVLENVRDSEPSALLQLDAYLHPADAPIAQPQPETFDDPASPWSEDGFRLFLSHIHDRREQAGALRVELAKRSIDTFVAHDAIEPTEEWQEVILSALRSSDACLALLTPGFHESKWTDQEIGFCMARDRLVIPLEYGLTPYGFLGKYQALSVRTGQTYADVALAVFELLVRKDKSRDAMARALVARWRDTRSFAAARTNYGFLKMIPQEAWRQPLVTEVWTARDRNSELSDANINWQASDVALADLFAGMPFQRPTE